MQDFSFERRKMLLPSFRKYEVATEYETLAMYFEKASLTFGGN